jgi:hypothetical protein
MICHFVEVMYFRFFVGDDDYCRTIQVAAEAEYGAPILTVSNIVAYPAADDYSEIVFNNEDSFYYAEAVIWLCPNANEFYDRGTYSVAVTAGTPTAFVLEVKVSPQTLPIPEPPVRISCDDVPPEEYIWGSQSVCAEDGRTKDLFTVRESFDPIPIFIGRFFRTIFIRVMTLLCLFHQGVTPSQWQ